MVYQEYTEEERIVSFWNRVDKSNGDDSCWNWKPNKNTIKHASLRWGKRKDYAHRISYELAFGVFSRELLVLHHCDNPSCVNPKHLFIGTTQDNVDDRERKGRNVLVYGERHGNCRITDEQVADMRYSFETLSATIPELAAEYKITEQYTKKIVHYRARTIPTNHKNHKNPEEL